MWISVRISSTWVCISKWSKPSATCFFTVWFADGNCPSGSQWDRKVPVVLFLLALVYYNEGALLTHMERGFSQSTWTLFTLWEDLAPDSGFHLLLGGALCEPYEATGMTDTTGPGCSTSHCHPNSAQPDSFSVVSLGSLGLTSHSSWILKYSIWSANSLGRWPFLAVGSICAGWPLLGVCEQSASSF